MKMKLNDIPNIPGVQFPEKISVAVSKEMHEGVQKLKKLGKDRSAFLRMAIERALKDVNQESA